jgi:hypothetical protein
VETFSPLICAATGSSLVFLKEGQCKFRVFTDGNLDYQSTSAEFSEEIKSQRTKQILAIESIPIQTVENLPRRIPRSTILSLDGTVIVPISKTPTICFGTFDSITVISGGVCTLTYQSSPTSDFLASDLYILEFEIKKKPQTLQMSLPATLDAKSDPLQLNAISTSGGSVEFISNSRDICLVSQGFLRIIGLGNCNMVATQSGNHIFEAVSKEFSILITSTTIELNKKKCFKKKKSQTFFSDKCPKGWKAK